MANPGYNTIQYDTNQYDASTSLLTLSLSDSSSSSDTKIFNDSTTKTETVTNSDVILKTILKAALVESITNTGTATLQDFITRVESIVATDSMSKLTNLTKTELITSVDLFIKLMATSKTETITSTAIAAMIVSRTLTDSTSMSDTMSKLVNAVKAENISLSSALTNIISVAEFDAEILLDVVMKAALNGLFENVSVSETTPQASAMYNTFQYNTRMYGQPFRSGFVIFVNKAANESIALLENFTRLVNFVRTLTDSVTITAVLAFVNSRQFIDFIFMEDVATKQVTGKAMNDSVRAGDWLRIVHNFPTSPWTQNGPGSGTWTPQV